MESRDKIDVGSIKLNDITIKVSQDKYNNLKEPLIEKLDM